MSKKGGRRVGMSDNERDEETAQMLRLRRSGASYDAIAKHFKLSKATVWARIKAALESQPVPEAQHLRDLELLRLDELERRLQAGVEQGEVKSIDATRRVIEARVKLLGLNRPPSQELILSQNAEEYSAQLLSMFDDELKE